MIKTSIIKSPVLNWDDLRKIPLEDVEASIAISLVLLRLKGLSSEEIAEELRSLADSIENEGLSIGNVKQESDLQKILH